MTPRPARQTIRRLNAVGLVSLFALIAIGGGWAATSQLAGAVISPGTIVVESNVKKVQHPSGGIVGEILVKEGHAVEAGQLAVRLDETLTRATLGIVRSQLDELLARQARLDAERDEHDALTFPDSLLDRVHDQTVATATENEKRLFQSRRQAREGQRAQLRERIAQIKEETSGILGQRKTPKSTHVRTAAHLGGGHRVRSWKGQLSERPIILSAHDDSRPVHRIRS